MELASIIIHKIKEQGPISFRDFMEMALYYPGVGYYTSPRLKIGRTGDYCTSTQYTSLFGFMIARQLEEMWHVMGKQPFTIAEYGAGTGALCNEVLQTLKNNSELYNALTYCIIEKSPAMQQQEKELLHEKVCWHNSLTQLDNFSGCVISNELLDNFAVHQVVMQKELMEIFVDYHNGFCEVLQPAAEPLKEYLAAMQVTLPQGYRTEINLQAIDWLKEISQSLHKGFVMTIDYGNLAHELYNIKHKCGTLMCFNKHNTNTNYYNNIGEQDITAHVNFTALQHWGLQNNLQCCGYTTQAGFLQSLGFIHYLRKLEQESQKKATASDLNWLQSFWMEMGNKFKVLIQHKGLQLQTKLMGLQLAQRIA